MAAFNIASLVATLQADDLLTPALAKAKAEQAAFAASTQGVVQELAKFAQQMEQDGHSADGMRAALDGVARAMGQESAAAAVNAALVEEAAAKQKAALESLLGTVGKLALGFTAFSLAQRAIADLKSEIADTVGHMENLAQSELKLSTVTGMTATQAGEFIAVGERFGVTADTMTTAFVRIERGMQGVLDQMEGGVGHQAKFTQGLKDLNISLTDTEGHTKTAREVFLEMSDAIAKAGPGTEATAAAVDLLGGHGGGGGGMANLIVMFQQGRVSLQEMMDLAKDWGNVITDENLPAVIALSREQNTLKQQWDGIKLTIGESLIPALTGMAAGADLVIKGIKGVVDEQTKFDGIAPNKGQIDFWKSLGSGIDEVGRLAAGAFDILLAVAELKQGGKSWNELTAEVAKGWDLISNARTAAIQDAIKADQDMAAAAASAANQAAPGGGGGSLADPAKELRVQRELEDMRDRDVKDIQAMATKEADAWTAYDKRVLDERNKLSVQLHDLYRSETDAQAGELQRASDIRFNLAKEETKIGQERVKDEADDAQKIADIRKKLAADIADKWRTLEIDLTRLNEEELKREAANAQSRLDELRSYSQQVAGFDFSDKQRAESRANDLKKIQQSASEQAASQAQSYRDQQATADQAWADKETGFAQQRADAHAAADKKVVDAQQAASDEIVRITKEQNQKVADAEATLFGTETVGPLTAASLDARRQAAEAVLKATVERNRAIQDGTQKGQESVEKAKTGAQQELASKLEAIADQEAAEKKHADEQRARDLQHYNEQKALDAQHTADALAQLKFQEKQAADKDVVDRALAKSNADYKIAQLVRDNNAAFDSYNEQFKAAQAQYDYVVGRAKSTADEQITAENKALRDKLDSLSQQDAADKLTTSHELTDLQQTADRRYKDYLDKVKQDWTAEGEAIKASGTERDTKITDAHKLLDEQIKAEDKKLERIVADNLKIIQSNKAVRDSYFDILTLERQTGGHPSADTGTSPVYDPGHNYAVYDDKGNVIGGSTHPQAPPVAPAPQIAQQYVFNFDGATFGTASTQEEANAIWQELMAIGRARGANLSP